jgi:hypothetical protein
MRLKLGDIDIAGTQVLYSTTGNNTDGAMTQAATTTELNLKANDTDVVHKTGDENYTGLKTNIITLNLNERTYTNSNPIQTNIDATTTQSFYHDLYTDIIRDINGNYLSWNTTTIGTNKSVNKQISARCKNTDNTGNITSAIQVCASPNGSTWATAPASDINGSIVTTVNKSKAANGYFRLGNGLIIQWGHVAAASGDTKTVTFSTAFSNTNYYVHSNINRSGSTGSGWGYVTSKTTTNCKLTTSSDAVDWIAIGY